MNKTRKLGTKIKKTKFDKREIKDTHRNRPCMMCISFISFFLNLFNLELCLEHNCVTCTITISIDTHIHHCFLLQIHFFVFMVLCF